MKSQTLLALGALVLVVFILVFRVSGYASTSNTAAVYEDENSVKAEGGKAAVDSNNVLKDMVAKGTVPSSQVQIPTPPDVPFSASPKTKEVYAKLVNAVNDLNLTYKNNKKPLIAPITDLINSNLVSKTLPMYDLYTTYYKLVQRLVEYNIALDPGLWNDVKEASYTYTRSMYEKIPLKGTDVKVVTYSGLRDYGGEYGHSEKFQGGNYHVGQCLRSPGCKGFTTDGKTVWYSNGKGSVVKDPGWWKVVITSDMMEVPKN